MMLTVPASKSSCYSLFQYRDKKGFQSHIHFAVGQEFIFVVQGRKLASKARHSGRSHRSGRDEAAGNNESHEGYDKENHSEGKNGRWQQLVVSDLLAADSKKASLHSG